MKQAKSNLAKQIIDQLNSTKLDVSFELLKDQEEEHELILSTKWAPHYSISSARIYTGNQTSGTWADNRTNRDFIKKDCGHDRFKWILWETLEKQQKVSLDSLKKNIRVHTYPKHLSNIETCSGCGGNGEIICPACGGRGVREYQWGSYGKEQYHTARCTSCLGGVIFCRSCGGHGCITSLRSAHACYAPSISVQTTASDLIRHFKAFLEKENKDLTSCFTDSTVFSLKSIDKKTMSTVHAHKIVINYVHFKVDQKKYSVWAYSTEGETILLNKASVIEDYLKKLKLGFILSPRAIKELDLNASRKAARELYKVPFFKTILKNKSEISDNDVRHFDSVISVSIGSEIKQSLNMFLFRLDAGFPHWAIPLVIGLNSVAWFHCVSQSLFKETLIFGILINLIFAVAFSKWRSYKNKEFESFIIRRYFFIKTFIALCLLNYMVCVISSGVSERFAKNLSDLPVLINPTLQVSIFEDRSKSKNEAYAKLGIIYAYATTPNMTIGEKQSILKSFNLYAGTIDSKWGKNSKKAAKKLIQKMRAEGLISEYYKNISQREFLCSFDYDRPDQLNIFFNSAKWLLGNGYMRPF